jgi:hypothetical protein
MGTHDLHVEVRGSCIAITLPGFAYSVTYYTAAGNRRLISEPGWGRSIAGAPMTLSEAYGALNRARDRFLHEVKAKSLTHAGRNALSAVFERDNFIEGMGTMRGISEHVVPKNGARLYRPDGSSFEITSSSSAALAFSAPRVTLIDVSGNPQPWDHPRNLAEAERRVTAKFKKAEDD